MLAKRLRLLMEKYQVGIDNVAGYAGIDIARVSLMLSGDVENPSIEILNKLADYFKVSVDYLTGRTDDDFIYAQERRVITFVTGAVRTARIQEYLNYLKSTKLKETETEEARQNVIAVVEMVLEVKKQLVERFPNVVVPLNIDWSQN